MSFRYFVNEDIRSHRVMLVGGENQKATEMNRNDAIRQAQEQNLDLVAISKSEDDTPVCKIMDYGKFKYEQSKKKSDKKSKTPSLKEITFSPNISEHDLEIKRNKVGDFLKKKHKVKYGVSLKGRQRAYRGNARELLENEIARLKGKAKAEPISESGHLIYTTLSPV